MRRPSRRKGGRPGITERWTFETGHVFEHACRSSTLRCMWPLSWQAEMCCCVLCDQQSSASLPGSSGGLPNQASLITSVLLGGCRNLCRSRPPFFRPRLCTHCVPWNSGGRSIGFTGRSHTDWPQSHQPPFQHPRRRHQYPLPHTSTTSVRYPPSCTTVRTGSVGTCCLCRKETAHPPGQAPMTKSHRKSRQNPKSRN